MKNLILKTSLIIALLSSQLVFSQTNRVPASAGRAEYIEVEPGVKLHVTDLGEGQTIVLIHGWPLNDEMYQYQYQYLVRKGFRVIGISLRGFGKSDKPYGKYNFDVFSDDIYAVLHTLKIKNAVLGGFSMGGAVTIHYVNKYKSAHVSKLALFATAAPSWKQREGYNSGVSEQDASGLIKQTLISREELIADFGAAFAAKGTSLSKNTQKWLENINLSAHPYAMTESISALGDLDLRPILKNINIPVAIFQGTKDQLIEFTMAEQLNKGLKNSYIVKFEQSGHALLESVDAINSDTYQSYIKVLYLNEGYKIKVDFEVYQTAGPTLFFVSPNQVLSIEKLGGQPGRLVFYNRDFYCIQLHDHEVACDGLLFNNINNIPMTVIPDQDAVFIQYLFSRIEDEFELKDGSLEEMIRTYLKQLLIMSTRLWKVQHLMGAMAVGHNNDIEFFRKFTQLVEANYKEKHNVADYAQMLMIAPKTLTHKFKRLNLPQPNDIIKNRIILEAKRLLIYTGRTAKEIAYALGYEDPAYFSRLFFIKTGTPPSSFRVKYLSHQVS